MNELPTPYYQDDYCTIYHADCRSVLPLLPKVDLVLTDPPYGIKRFENGIGKGDRMVNKSIGAAFNNNTPDADALKRLLAMGKEAIIWGYNNLDLPRSEHFLVWDKEQTVDNFASAEIAFANVRQPAKVFRYPIHRHNHAKAGGHPTEKPVPLMAWCIQQADNPQTILDAYCGIGTTLRAAKDLRRHAIGIEIEEKYCEIGARRLSQEVLPLEYPTREEA